MLWGRLHVVYWLDTLFVQHSLNDYIITILLQVHGLNDHVEIHPHKVANGMKPEDRQQGQDVPPKAALDEDQDLEPVGT